MSSRLTGKVAELSNVFPNMSPQVRLPSLAERYTVDESASGLKGTGGFSRVVRATCKATGEPRAIKIMKKSDLTGKKKSEMVAHEKETLRRARHPRVVHLYEVIETDDTVCFVLELMKQDLYSYIRESTTLTERDAACVMRGLLQAVAYLHEHNIVHRDIKPGNILLNSPDDIRLADFGLAKLIASDVVANTPCGTVSYMAPEIIKGIQRDGPSPVVTTREAVKYVDIWSSGIVLYMLLSGRLPFRGSIATSAECRALLEKMDTGVLFPDTYWESISEPAKDLVLRLLTWQPQSRISAAEALEHPFLKGADRMSPTPLQTPTVLGATTAEEFARCVDDVQNVNIVANDDGDDVAAVPKGEAKVVTYKEPKGGNKPIEMNPKLMERRNNHM